MPRQMLLAAASTLALAACDPVVDKPATPPAPTPDASQQTWLCGREFENKAWGFQRRGNVIDMQGNIWHYDFKGSPTALPNPWQAKDLAHMSKDELKMRYNGAMVTATKIPAADIARNFPLITEAAKAQLTERKIAGADRGANVLYCYSYDAASHNYAQILLDQNGDWTQTNPSDAAKKLIAWLDSAIGPQVE